MTNDEANYLIERLKVLCADITELLNQATEEIDRIEQADTPQTETSTNSEKLQLAVEPQTEDYDFRDEQEYNDRWNTDCGWK